MLTQHLIIIVLMFNSCFSPVHVTFGLQYLIKCPAICPVSWHIILRIYAPVVVVGACERHVVVYSGYLSFFSLPSLVE